jgi:preprotein translocase subunit SecG
MNLLFSVVMAIQVCAALIVIGLVLLQHGKGADMGAGFGAGASGSLFGAAGSSSFLSRTTAIAATVFFCATLGLTYLDSQRPVTSNSVMDQIPQPKTIEEVLPAMPASSAASTEVKTEPAAAAQSTNRTEHADQIPK